MKSSEISTANSTQVLESIILPEVIKNDLENIQNILQNDHEFFDKLVKECMKIGKGEPMYFRCIENLLAEEYPDLTTYKDGYELIQTTYDFVKQLCSQADEIRTQIEQNIEQVFLMGDNYE